jgi:hypothetical protein
MGRFRWLETSLQDLRYGVRQLRRDPGFAAAAIIMLALGIGVTTTIFTAANDFLLHPLPFGNSDRLVMVKRYDPKLEQSGWTDPPSFKYWREQNQVFDGMAAWSEITHQVQFDRCRRAGARARKEGFLAVFSRSLGSNPISAGRSRPRTTSLAGIA